MHNVVKDLDPKAKTSEFLTHLRGCGKTVVLSMIRNSSGSRIMTRIRS